MSHSNRTIAHELFYLKDSAHTEMHGSNFSVKRGKDYTAAYSYSTPIAVYPDGADFVLIDSAQFSKSTSKHQCYVHYAVPANVRVISFNWLDCNDCFGAWSGARYKERFKQFNDNLLKSIEKIGTSLYSYAYADERNSNLRTLDGLERYAEISPTPVRIRKAVSKARARLTDKEKIKEAQKQLLAKVKRRRSEIRRQREEDVLRRNIRMLLRENEHVKDTLLHAAESLSTQLRLSEQRQLDRTILPGLSEKEGMIAHIVKQETADFLREIWKEHASAASWDTDCDLYWFRDQFVTTKGVTILNSELQRCLNLWRTNRLLGEKVDTRYRVLANDSTGLTIGCHHFAQCTVRDIESRYYGKDDAQITEEETQRTEIVRTIVCNALMPTVKLVAEKLEAKQEVQQVA